MTRLLAERLEPLMEKPGWQRALILIAFLLVLIFLMYLAAVRGMWQQLQTLTHDIASAQQGISRTQAALLRLPPLEHLQRELKHHAQVERQSLPLEQQFAQPLQASQARLIRWQPVPDAKAQPEGELELQASFTGLMDFLYAMQQGSQHPALSELSLHTNDAGLVVSVLLTQTPDAEKTTELTQAVVARRDPFAAPQSSACASVLQAADWTLSGVSQTGDLRSGWLLSPDGQWSKVETGTRFGTPPWTVELLSASQVALTLSDARCGVQRQILRLGTRNDSPGKGQ